MTKAQPRTLVQPQVIHESDTVGIWHSGLVSSFGYLHITVLACGFPDPGLGRRPVQDAHNVYEGLAVSILDGRQGEIIPIFYGMGSASNPIASFRITDIDLSGDKNELRINQTALGVNYVEQFSA